MRTFTFRRSVENVTLRIPMLSTLPAKGKAEWLSLHSSPSRNSRKERAEMKITDQFRDALAAPSKMANAVTVCAVISVVALILAIVSLAVHHAN